MSHRHLAIVFIAGGMLVTPTLAQQHEEAKPQTDQSWLEVQVKARSILINPHTAQQHEVFDEHKPMGVLSPDGTKVAFIASDPARVKDGQDFDLFVADVDPNQPAATANARRLTTEQDRPAQPHWLPDGRGIAFQAADEADETLLQVWYVDVADADSPPVRLTDARQRCHDLSTTPSGDIAYIVHKGSKNKQQFKDLVVRPAPGPRVGGGNMRVLLHDQHISSYAISPDGKTLAWSGLGSMFLVDLETGTSREVPLHGIHRQLLNHTVHEFAWRPDGKVIAIHCGFLGGVSRGAIKRIGAFDPANPLGDAGPDEPWPRMFAEDKVFFVPVDWKPSPESLKVTRENFPSPTAEDAKAELSTPAGDESTPWWVRELPMRPLGMTWISAEEAKQRIATQGR